MLKSIIRSQKKKFIKAKILNRPQRLYAWMTGRAFLVHNGKDFLSLEVVRLRLGSKAGEFVQTRKAPVHKKKKRK